VNFCHQVYALAIPWTTARPLHRRLAILHQTRINPPYRLAPRCSVGQGSVAGSSAAVRCSHTGKPRQGSGYPLPVPKFRIAQAAELLGISDDTKRRWIDSGDLPVERVLSRWMEIDGATVAAFARHLAHPTRDSSPVSRSARNQFVGLVTKVSDLRHSVWLIDRTYDTAGSP
jgi:excisionase family DNA binding protein